MMLHPVSSFAYSAALICSAAAVSIAFLRTVVVSHAQPLQLQMSQSNKLTMHSVKSIRNFNVVIHIIMNSCYYSNDQITYNVLQRIEYWS